MNKTVTFFASGLFLALVSGCGSGGGSDPGATYPITTSNLRAIQTGDQLAYAVSYDGAFFDGSGEVSIRGELTENFSRGEGLAYGDNEKPGFNLLTRTSILQADGQNVTAITSFAQDMQMNFIRLSDDEDEDCFVPESEFDAGRAPLVLPGTFSVGFVSDIQVSMVCENGDSLVHRYRVSVVRNETVSVPAGRFDSFVSGYSLASQRSNSFGFLVESHEESGLVWVNPEFGIVKSVGSSQTGPTTFNAEFSSELISFDLQ